MSKVLMHVQSIINRCQALSPEKESGDEATCRWKLSRLVNGLSAFMLQCGWCW